jgi:hypothetical protein
MARKVDGQSGQAGLIVLLIMVVVTTIAVSVSTRSVSELRISRQEQESTRTLNLAESGIEEILRQDLYTVMTTTPLISVAGNTIPYDITPQNTISGYSLPQGHTLEVDVEGATTLQIVINSPASGCARGLVVTLIKTNYDLTRQVYRPAGCSTLGVDLPIPPSGIPTNGYKMARIKALFSLINLTVSRDAGTRPLYYTVKTTATLDDGSTRAVSVNKFPGSLPSIFDYVLFSGTSLTK